MTTSNTEDAGRPRWASLAMDGLRASLESYTPLAPATWSAFARICRPTELQKGAHMATIGEVPSTIGYVHSGLVRCYTLDLEGREYNKIFFSEGMMPGAVVALLKKEPSEFGLQALERTLLIEIDHPAYRRLLERYPDLLMYHCLYLEQNWVMKKEPREVAFAQQTAAERYEVFLRDHPELEGRIPQGHIASHLGITPTQLSRIRRERARKKDSIVDICK